MDEEIILETISWQAPEYSHRERDNDWYWTIGLVALVSTVIALYMGNYLFAIFLLLGGGSLILFTLRHPQQVDFIIETKGITFGRDVHTWETIKGFNIKRNMGDDSHAKLLLLTNKHFLPIYNLPLPPEYINTVRENLSKVIPANSSLQESPSMLFMEKIGF